MVPPGRVKERPKKKVIFVCIGNSCRSQMAEAFARSYGSDVMVAQSAGIAPATMIAPLTKQILEERNLRIDEQFPKGLDITLREKPDLIVNMSGQRLAVPSVQVMDWKVPDPIGQKEQIFRAAADQIEALVMRLILNLRAGRISL